MTRLFLVCYLLTAGMAAGQAQTAPAAQADTSRGMSVKQLSAVTVTGERTSLQRANDQLVFNISGNKLYASAANAYDVLRKLPGLEVNGDGTLTISGRVAPTVFIDGKPSPMSPEALQNYLAGLSADMIASITIINNPSSRYDSEYKGIIDIRLKKDMTLGWKGSASINLQQNAYFLADNNLSLTYKTPKVAYTARLGYTAGDRPYRYGAYQHLHNTNIQTTTTGRRTGHNDVSYQLGADYRLGKDQQLELIWRGSQLNRRVLALNTLHVTDAGAHRVVDDTHQPNYSEPRQDNQAAHLNYTGRLGQTQVEALGALVMIRNRQSEDIRNFRTATGDQLHHWITDLKNDILIRSLQADLSRPIAKGRLGLGAKFALTTTRNDLRYDTLTKEAAFILDSSRTNAFHYDEYISAAYLSYEHTGDKWSYALSLRAEHTRSVANAITVQEVTTRNYLKWLPGFSVTYALQDGRQLNLSYSSRMTRPNFAQLNPFRFYYSPLNYWVGNPLLLPSVTRQLQLAYTHRALNIALQAGRESDPQARYPEYDTVTNVLQYLGRNLPYNDFAAVEISFPLRVNHWWRMNNTVRGMYKKELTPYHNVNYDIPITDYSISGSQVFTLPRAVTLDITYFYRSRSGNGLYRIKPIGNLDLGLQKSWLKGKLNSRVNYYDIFDTYRVHYTFREKQIINNQLTHWFGTRRLALTLSYNFGTSTHKDRQRGRQEEETRAGM